MSRLDKLTDKELGRLRGELGELRAWLLALPRETEGIVGALVNLNAARRIVDGTDEGEATDEQTGHADG